MIYKSSHTLHVQKLQYYEHKEQMVSAFYCAGFAPVDVHMNDLEHGSVDIHKFSGIVACGGFSHGDVFGAGIGWAHNIISNTTLRTQFSSYFARNDVFTLGVCNGCQMLSLLNDIMPGNFKGFGFNSVYPVRHCF